MITRITNPKEIYERIEVGDTIAYYRDGRRREDTLKIDKVIKIEWCGKQSSPICSCNSSEYKCDRYIFLDKNKNMDCFGYSGRTCIKYIEKFEEFLTEEDMTI